MSSCEAPELCCPGCRGRLLLDPPRNEVTCEGCDRVYALRDGVPILLLDDARQRSRRLTPVRLP